MVDKVAIIDSAGQVITDRLETRFVKLPRVVGEGAETRVHEIMAILDDAPDLQTKVRASMLVSHRRWDLFLDNGVQVKLPAEKACATRVAELARVDAVQPPPRPRHHRRRPPTFRSHGRCACAKAREARDEQIAARDKAMKKREQQI